MRRRHLLQSLAGAAFLPRPSLADPPRILRFVPQADLANPDPVWTTATIASIHGRMIWDNLYGQDESLATQPQMVAGHEVSDDGLTWTLTLRDGLLFHDNQPVRMIDAATSIIRTGKRSPIVETLLSVSNEMTPLDDKRLIFRLKKRFPLLPFALSGVSIMPERIARTDAYTQISEYVGSGPYVFVRDEWKAGTGAVYARFGKYVPRAEPISMWAGGKVAHFDRVEWKTMPDSATAAAALLRNEVDWWENPLIDLVPNLKKSTDLKVEVFDQLGSLMVLAFNHGQPPFDNVKLRRAVLAAVDQNDYVDAIVGDQKSYGRTGVGFFPLGSPYASTAGMEALTARLPNGRRDVGGAKRMVDASGYAGEKIVLMSPSDQPNLVQMAQVTNALYKSLGLNVEYASMDWGTMVQRRNTGEPVDKGGWSSFNTGWGGLSVSSPATSQPLRGNGAATRTWWRPTSARMEALRDAWFDAPDLAAQKAICDDMQRVAFDVVPFVPVGQDFSPTAYRADLTGFARSSVPVFWGVRRV